MASLSRKKSITIQDVARHAKASISTVSNVINGKGYVSVSKRRDILRSVEILGYVPSTSARNLALARTHNIGFVLRESHFTHSEPFYTRIFLGAEFESRKHDHYVLLATIPDEYHVGVDTPRFVRERNVDGVIVAGSVPTAFIEELVDVGLPFILVDYSHADYPCLSIDNRGGVIEAISYLIEKKGHRSIAFLGAYMSHPSIRERLQGYRIALFQAGITLNEEYVLTDATAASPTHEIGFSLAEQFFRLEDRPNAVFCVNDAMALGFMRYAHENGFRIPEDVALIGFDDVDGAVFASPPLTTVRVFKEQFGEMAMRQLIEKVEGSSRSDGSYRYDRTTERLLLSTVLVVRGSA